MNQIVRAPRPAAPAPKPPPGGPLPFRRALLWVAVAHVVVLLAFLLQRAATKPVEPPPGPVMEFIPLPPVAQPRGSAPAAPDPAPASVPPPTPTPPQPQPDPTPETPAPPAPTPDPTPTPTPAVDAPSDIVIPKTPKPEPKKVEPKAETKPKPEPAKAEKPIPPEKPEKTEKAEKTPKPVKPAEHKPQVSLTPVTRPSAPSQAAAQAPTTAPSRPAAASGNGPGLKASGVSDQLSKALQGSGATAPVTVGPAGGGGGGGNGSWYYGLIRDEMYRAWDQPVDLSGKGYATIIRVTLADDGRITGSSIERSSGNTAFDQSALAAARRVNRLSKPKPADIADSVTIAFRLLD
ncbi:TonB family C-terminal domain-containing protein [Verrucomicrobium sp. GAS474]|uniref:energy transducer TonB n=1 Tax=Verrucomicrobium sp. GAS474 TaxID=1882831 RepID=UPI00087BE835|nr:TonB family protein [Verrucomicrobium sp. GAS474]SDT93520.1 TonB family C-terminal domain-containing protein [Verrucomicrobium sp. GAS474]